MKPLCLVSVFFLLGSTVLAADKEPAAEDSIAVTVVGTLRTGIVAIGGETTGTTITAKGITWELDFGKNADFRKTAEKFNGKKVVVEGSLERRRGVEIKERWIVTVTGLRAFEKGSAREGTALDADEQSALVQVRVLDGSGRYEEVGDMEIWISQAAAKKGSPLAKPYTGWIALNGDNQRLYTPEEGSFYIDGNAIERSGNYQVEIDGCDGDPLDKTVLLKPGERRVIRLTDYPAPNNVFIALEAPVSEKAKERAEAMKANAKTYVLELHYNGDEDKPFYRMIVSVPVVKRRRNSPFNRIVQGNEEQATRIIDHLAREGFLDHAVDLRTNIKIPPPTMPGYTMKVTVGDVEWYDDLGWRLSMIQRLDGLRAALPDDGKKDMDFLLGRLSGLRKQWNEEPALDANVGREGSKVRFVTEDNKTIIDITSEFGIDNATIRRKSDEWPKSILVRLHLSGLESFKAGSGNVAVEWSVSSMGDHAIRTSLVSGKRVAALDDKNPYFTEVRIVADKKKIPLKGGYFEVPLPAKLFAGNPEEITLRWIDFYRN